MSLAYVYNLETKWIILNLKCGQNDRLPSLKVFSLARGSYDEAVGIISLLYYLPYEIEKVTEQGGV